MRVLITHPGMQHSHQLAWALEEAGLLAGFWSGVPVADSGCASLDTWARLSPSIRRIPVPAAKRSHLVAFPVARRILAAQPV